MKEISKLPRRDCHLSGEDKRCAFAITNEFPSIIVVGEKKKNYHRTNFGTKFSAVRLNHLVSHANTNTVHLSHQSVCIIIREFNQHFICTSSDRYRNRCDLSHEPTQTFAFVLFLLFYTFFSLFCITLLSNAQFCMQQKKGYLNLKKVWNLCAAKNDGKCLRLHYSWYFCDLQSDISSSPFLNYLIACLFTPFLFQAS